MIKKLLYSFGILAAFATAAKAQITVTMSDVATIGKVIKQATDTVPAPSTNPGGSGANVTWNFSALNTHVIDTLTFTNPNWTPWGASFPSSNLAVQIGTNGWKGTAYTQLTGGTFNIVGQHATAGTSQVNVVLNPVEVLSPFPATYNTSYTNTSGYNVKFPYSQPPVDSVRLKEKKVKIGAVTAYGTVTTPLMSNTPCIRYRVLQRKWDTTWVHVTFPTPQWTMASATYDTLVHFVWWANSIGFPLIEMDSTWGTPTIKNVTWLMATPTNNSVFDMNNNVSELNAFPNPATDMLGFDLTGLSASYIRVTDIAGREVKRFNVSNDIEWTDVGMLAPGVYLYNVMNRGGTIVARGKFNVVK